MAFENASGMMKGDGAPFDTYGVTTCGRIITTLTALNCLDGEPAESRERPFGDAEAGIFYENAIIWATANQIVDGYGQGKFGRGTT